jgi:hypothetical protein
MPSRLRRRDQTPVERRQEGDEEELLNELMYCESEKERDVLIDQLRQLKQKKALDKLYEASARDQRNQREEDREESGTESQPPPSLVTKREAPVIADSSGGSGDEWKRRSRASHRSAPEAKASGTGFSHAQPPPGREVGSEDKTQNLSAQAVSSLKAAVEAMEAIKRNQERNMPFSSSDHEATENDTTRGNNIIRPEQGGFTPRDRITPKHSNVEANDSPASKVAMSEASSLASSVVDMLEKGQTAGL